MIWTDERVKLLKTLWGEGLSGSQIAAELGGVSRNTILGKAHRLGLQKRLGRTQPTARESSRKSALREYAPLKQIDPAPALVLVQPPTDTSCSILELTSERCHWPYGDPRDKDFFFCGAIPKKKKNYLTASITAILPTCRIRIDSAANKSSVRGSVRRTIHHT